MDEPSQRAVAAWAVFILPFLVLGGYLHLQDRLTAEIVALYWFPAVVLVLVGRLPPPWEPLVG